MGHRQDMTPRQRTEWDVNNYRKRLEANKGSNYEYWNSKHDKLLENGWDVYLWTEKPSRQWGAVFTKCATSSEEKAKKAVIELRAKGNYARIICGYEPNKLRIKMFSVIFKPK